MNKLYDEICAHLDKVRGVTDLMELKRKNLLDLYDETLSILIEMQIKMEEILWR